MDNRTLSNEKGPIVIVACRVMEPELEKARDHDSRVEIRYLDQGLHRTPETMADLIQPQVDEAAQNAVRIVLGYGLCSNGIVGVKAGPQGLLIPSCHDCIAFFLGSPEAYGKAFEERPGTYYLTPGWVSERKDPLGIVEDDYTARVGREMAVWAMEEELKHYTHISLINTGIGDLGPLRERAKENARFFEKKYKEVQGNLTFFRKLIHGPYEDDFFFIDPSRKVEQELFLTK